MIRRPFYHVAYFMISLAKLLLGFPERNIPYLSVVYGFRYAAFYRGVGKFTPPIKDWFATGGFLILLLIIMLCVLPFVVAYNICLAVGKAVQWISLLIYGAVLAAAQLTYWLSVVAAHFFIKSVFVTLQIASSTTINYATFISTLRLRDWLVVFAVAWLAIAEYHHVPSWSNSLDQTRTPTISFLNYRVFSFLLNSTMLIDYALLYALCFPFCSRCLLSYAHSLFLHYYLYNLYITFPSFLHILQIMTAFTISLMVSKSHSL